MCFLWAITHVAKAFLVMGTNCSPLLEVLAKKSEVKLQQRVKVRMRKAFRCLSPNKEPELPPEPMGMLVPM